MVIINFCLIAITRPITETIIAIKASDDILIKNPKVPIAIPKIEMTNDSIFFVFFSMRLPPVVLFFMKVQSLSRQTSSKPQSRQYRILLIIILHPLSYFVLGFPTSGMVSGARYKFYRARYT